MFARLNLLTCIGTALLAVLLLSFVQNWENYDTGLILGAAVCGVICLNSLGGVIRSTELGQLLASGPLVGMQQEVKNITQSAAMAKDTLELQRMYEGVRRLLGLGKADPAAVTEAVRKLFAAAGTAEKHVAAVQAKLKLPNQPTQAEVLKEIGALQQRAETGTELAALTPLLVDAHTQFGCAAIKTTKKTGTPTPKQYLDAITAQLRQLTEAEQSKSPAVPDDSAALAKAREEISGLQAKLDETSAALQRVTQSRDSLSGNNAELRRQVGEAKSALERAADANGTLNEKLGTEKARTSGLQAEIDELRPKLTAASDARDTAARDLQEMQGKYDALAKEKEELLAAAAANDELLTAKEAALTSGQQEIQTLQERITAADAQVTERTRQLTEMTDQLRQLTELNAEFVAANEAAAALNAEYVEVHNQDLALREEQATKVADLEAKLKAALETSRQPVVVQAVPTGKVRSLNNNPPTGRKELEKLNAACAAKLQLIVAEQDFLFHLIGAMLVEIYQRAKDPQNKIHQISFVDLIGHALDPLDQVMAKYEPALEFQRVHAATLKGLPAFDEFDANAHRREMMSWFAAGILSIGYEAATRTQQPLPSIDEKPVEPWAAEAVGHHLDYVGSVA